MIIWCTGWKKTTIFQVYACNSLTYLLLWSWLISWWWKLCGKGMALRDGGRGLRGPPNVRNLNKSGRKFCLNPESGKKLGSSILPGGEVWSRAKTHPHPWEKRSRTAMGKGKSDDRLYEVWGLWFHLVSVLETNFYECTVQTEGEGRGRGIGFPIFIRNLHSTCCVI